MEYIKILSPQTCVIFQQYLTISDSRPIKLVKATRVIRDIEPPNIHSSLYDLLAMPNHLRLKTYQAGLGNQVNRNPHWRRTYLILHSFCDLAAVSNHL